LMVASTYAMNELDFESGTDKVVGLIGALFETAWILGWCSIFHSKLLPVIRACQFRLEACTLALVGQPSFQSKPIYFSSSSSAATAAAAVPSLPSVPVPADPRTLLLPLAVTVAQPAALAVSEGDMVNQWVDDLSSWWSARSIMLSHVQDVALLCVSRFVSVLVIMWFGCTVFTALRVLLAPQSLRQSADNLALFSFATISCLSWVGSVVAFNELLEVRSMQYKHRDLVRNLVVHQRASHPRMSYAALQPFIEMVSCVVASLDVEPLPQLFASFDITPRFLISLVILQVFLGMGCGIRVLFQLHRQ